MNRTIEITVLADGQTRVETQGFTGASCRDASRFLEQALGPATGEEIKVEFHQPAQHQQSVQDRGTA